MLLSKEEIRVKLINKCKLLSHEYRSTQAFMIMDNLIELVTSATSIAIYHASSFEFDLSYVIQQLIDLDKKVYQPIAYRDTRIMRFGKLKHYAKNDGNNKIFYRLDDEVEDEIEWYNMDLILMPLVAVSKNGYRLGRGGGYYDTTLSGINVSCNNIPDFTHSSKKPILCGVGFDIQIINELPVEKWDIKLNYFVSEKRILKFSER